MLPDYEYIELLKKRNNKFDTRFIKALKIFYKKFVYKFYQFIW